jgi:CRISPR/Cas system-associated exonuclease Cas4 (RecB family)
MTITRALFDAYLRCPTKCWLLSRGEPVSEHHVADRFRRYRCKICAMTFQHPDR